MPTIVMMSVTFYLLLCRMSLFWMSLCWMSLCWMSLCWVSHFIYLYAECHYAECCYAECDGPLQIATFKYYLVMLLKSPSIALVWGCFCFCLLCLCISFSVCLSATLCLCLRFSVSLVPFYLHLEWYWENHTSTMFQNLISLKNSREAIILCYRVTKTQKQSDIQQLGDTDTQRMINTDIQIEKTNI
jgi:hypothetical protein